MERILNKRGTYVNVLIAGKLQFSYSRGVERWPNTAKRLLRKWISYELSFRDGSFHVSACVVVDNVSIVLNYKMIMLLYAILQL